MSLKKRIFYWIVAVTLVAWSWTTLYVHSFSNLWGGGSRLAVRAGEERAKAVKQLAEMEKKGAPPEQIYDQRMSLSLRVNEAKNFVEARKILDAESDALIKLPESEENFLRRARVEDQVAHTYIDEGLYHEARNSLTRATDLVRQVINTYGSEDARLFELTLTNEIGVLTYLEASSTLDGKLREQTFETSKKVFEQLLSQINALEADPGKLTDAGRKHLSHMKDHVGVNLRQVKDDQANEGDFRRI